jgi:hypothetical protein
MEFQMAQVTQSVVSAEADARMAQDAWVRARRVKDATQQQMMAEATDANWQSWQERTKRVDREVSRAWAAFDAARARVFSARKAA